jgi:hypothetical protein
MRGLSGKTPERVFLQQRIQTCLFSFLIKTHCDDAAPWPKESGFASLKIRGMPIRKIAGSCLIVAARKISGEVKAKNDSKGNCDGPKNN